MLTYSKILWWTGILAFSRHAFGAKLCSPDECIKGSSQSPRRSLSPSRVSPSQGGKLTKVVVAHGSDDLVPGTYPTADFTVPDRLQDLSIISTNDHFTISLPSIPLLFGQNSYHDQLESLGSEWHSAYLPDGWYGTVSPGQALWGAVPKRSELKSLPGKARVMGNIGYDRCDPPCGPGGSCHPGNSSAVCQCRPGWTGDACDRCASGHYGMNCQPCGDGCTECDDGLAGTGLCIGSKTDSLKLCNCSHGSCGSDGQCTCSAGYIGSNSTSLPQCNTCAPGFFQTRVGDCLACPLGCTSCTLQEGTTSTASCTACASNLSLSTANPPICASLQTCQAGQFWNADSSSCQSCSPACATCTGPSPSQCLSCAAPRVNLAGTCVGYTSSSGICDSTLSGLNGVFVINNEKSACDACPAGCTDCNIPSFSSTASYSTLSCSSCHDGYLLESGRCVRTCSDGFYLPPDSAERNGTCQRCDDSCTTCIGSASSCTRCPEGLYAWGGHCTPACPYRTVGTNGTCIPCSSACGTCSTPLDAGACTSCPPDRPVLHNNRCFDHCPKAMYFDGTTCQRCDPGCSSCIASPITCTSCPEGSVLRKGECKTADCALVSGLGLCMSDLVTSTEKRLLPLIVLPIVLAAVAVAAGFYIRSQRRKRRAEVKQFGDAMDQVRVRHGEGDTVRFRLEKVLGLNRIRLQADDGQRRGLRNLLLPTRRAKEEEIGMSDTKKANMGAAEEARWSRPPPPYRDSTSSIPQRGETRLIPESKIISMSSPSPRSSVVGAGPPPPPRHKQPAEESSTRPTVRFSDMGQERRLDELWPARKVEGWI